MAEGDNAAQGDLLAGKDGAAAGAADGTKPDAGKADDAGKAAASDKAAADLKVAADAEAARVAALTPEQKAAELTARAAEKKALADGKKPDAKDGDKGKDEAVDYAKTLAEAVPEGMKLDEASAKIATDMFAKHGLSAEAVKDLAAFQIAREKAGADGAAKAFADQVEAWRAESTADKDLGKENMAVAKLAASKAFDTKTVELMEHFGLMNHPGVLKGLVKIGKAIKDDSFVPGDAGPGNGGADARKAFPNSNMNP